MDDYVMGKLPQLKFQINLIIDKVKILKTQAPMGKPLTSVNLFWIPTKI